MAGATQAAALPYAAPIKDESKITVYYLAAGNTVLTPAMLRYDLIVSVNPGATTVEVPQNATFGWTFVSGEEPCGFFQRRGAGVLAINFSGSATRVDDNDIDISSEGPYHRPVRLNGVAANEWTID
jgi:hypothetical protein